MERKKKTLTGLKYRIRYMLFTSREIHVFLTTTGSGAKKKYDKQGEIENVKDFCWVKTIGLLVLRGVYKFI